MAGEYIRDTQCAVEVLRDGAPNIRDTQCAVEILLGGGSNIRNTQTAVEILRLNMSAEEYIFYYDMLRRKR